MADAAPTGVDGKPIDTRVTLYEQGKTARFARDDTGSDGVIGFYLAEGTYRVRVSVLT